MKDMAIKFLKSWNSSVDGTEKIVTRLYYGDNDTGGFVEDFSFFANLNYMSQSLLDALSNKQTLTSTQEKELESFIIEARLKLPSGEGECCGSSSLSEEEHQWDKKEDKLSSITDKIWDSTKEGIDKASSENNTKEWNVTGNVFDEIIRFSEHLREQAESTPKTYAWSKSGNNSK